MSNFERSESLSRYYREINKYQPLTVAKERELTSLIQRGDHNALHVLMRHNLLLVVTIARRHVGQGMLFDDLIQEGNVGLLEAAKNYEPQNESMRFVSYAQFWIRKRLNEAVVAQGRQVRLPHNQEHARWLKKRDGLEVESLSPVELDAPVGDDSETTNGDRLLYTEPEANSYADLEHRNYFVSRLLGVLKPREQEVIRAYFGIGQEYAAPTDVIAKRLGLTQVRVSQIVKTACQKMKEAA